MPGPGPLLTAIAIVLGLGFAGIYQHRQRANSGGGSAQAPPLRWIDIVMDWGERAVIVLLAAAFVVSAWRSPHLWNRLMIVPEAITVAFVLIRRAAISVSAYPLDWGLAVLGTMSGLLARPGGSPLAPEVACASIILLGTSISGWAKLSLNTRFALAPANRGVQARFAYSLIRHPMYAGYVIAHMGFILMNPTFWNLGVYAVTWILLAARIHREELWLSQDPDFVAYVQKVRWRLIPGFY